MAECRVIFNYSKWKFVIWFLKSEISYNAGSVQARLNRFKKEAGSFPVVFLDQASISKDRGKVIRENIPVKRNQIPLLRSFKKPRRMIHCTDKVNQISKGVASGGVYTK